VCAIISPIAYTYTVYIHIAAGTWLGGGPAGVENRSPLANRVICEAVSVVSASRKPCLMSASWARSTEHAVTVGENNCWGRSLYRVNRTSQRQLIELLRVYNDYSHNRYYVLLMRSE